ncbi:MAG: DUF1318 domain-containing protein [Spirochaetota bacterium]|nr:DUF1318 domain-containing protein [Spirochaetota bacterium]
MNSLRIYIVSFFLSSFIFSGCSSNIPILRDIPSCCLISPPDIHLTGEKTVVERQIVGEYRELEKDAWVISSVKTNIQKSKGTYIAGGDRQILLALKIREFHEDKIRGYKGEGAIGEKNNGFVKYMRNPKYDGDRNLKTILTRVINEENRARKIIFARTLKRSGIKEPSEKEIEAFGRIFAEEQRALAKKNDLIQNNSGKWIRKR